MRFHCSMFITHNQMLYGYNKVTINEFKYKVPLFLFVPQNAVIAHLLYNMTKYI